MYLIGQGQDVHLIIKKKESLITLGGFSFSSDWKIIAHSDGDLVLHAIANAILGSIQKGDIGDYFDDGDISIKGISSLKIIQFAVSKLKKLKYELVNVDLTITCQKIMLNEKKKKICKSLQRILNTKLINVKATRFEYETNLIKCDAVVLVSKSI